MRKVLLLSAVSIASLGLTLSAAQAADVIPEPAPVPTWTGFHVGVGGGAGYNFYDAESDVTVFFEDGDPEIGEDFDPFAVLSDAITGNDLGAWYGFGTVEIGFDYQFADSPFVIGILGNYDFNGNSQADAEGNITVFPDVAPGGILSLNKKIEAELDDSWFVGGRLGFVLNENTLLYGLGGYTWIKGSVKSEHSLNGAGGVEIIGFDVDEEDNVDGWTIGGGLEHLITESLSLKIEYRHDFLDDIEVGERTVFEDVFDINDNAIDIAVEQDAKVDFSRDTVRAVLSWRFNPGL